MSYRQSRIHTRTVLKVYRISIQPIIRIVFWIGFFFQSMIKTISAIVFFLHPIARSFFSIGFSNHPIVFTPQPIVRIISAMIFLRHPIIFTHQPIAFLLQSIIFCHQPGSKISAKNISNHESTKLHEIKIPSLRPSTFRAFSCVSWLIVGGVICFDFPLWYS